MLSAESRTMIAMLRRVSFLGIFAVLAAAAALASCGQTSAPSPPGICGLPAGVQVALVYPEPGATGVSDTFTQVILASQGTLPATYDAALFGSTYNGFIPFGAVLPAQTPLPSPAATPPSTFTNPVYYTSTNPGGFSFASGTVVTVDINDLYSSCLPGMALGSFTVQ